MFDINGQELKEGDLVTLLCKIESADEVGVIVRILNSEQDLLVSVREDEVLGGLVASSELAKFTSEVYEPGSKPVPEVQHESEVDPCLTE